jgi:hypothetical protein
MREPLKPNRKGPRFKAPRLITTSPEWLAEISKDPDCMVKDTKKIRQVIQAVNKGIAETVVYTRDGIELPEQLGYLFLGTCQPKVRKNVDFKKTEYYTKVIQHRNWESDNYLAKIFYTNFETKYKFKFHELWGFKAERNFTKMVGQEYPKNWKMYRQIDHTLKISRLYRDYLRDVDREAIDEQLSDSYDPLEL